MVVCEGGSGGGERGVEEDYHEGDGEETEVG